MIIKKFGERNINYISAGLSDLINFLSALVKTDRGEGIAWEKLIKKKSFI